MDHVRELRTRLFFVAALFLVASSLAYTFREPIISMLLSPLEGEKLIYLNPAGGFNFIFMVSMYVGLAITTPLLIQQLYGFVKPALPQAIQHYSGRIFVGSLVLLVSGISFGYFFAIPGALRFLYGFANDYIQASLTADSYLSFLVAYTIGLGLVFQIPLLLMFFHWIKPMTPGGLLKSERWVILLSFIAAALITPTPDPLNQTIIAIPIIFVYQIGVFGVLLTIRKQRRREKLAATAIATVPVATPAPVLVVPAAQPAAAATPVFQPSTPQPKRRVRSIDGVMRSATPHRTMAIPERPTTIKQAAMTARRPTPLHRRPRYTLDGISRPLSAA
jgi:sec-independent protein translocase protein TatC